MNIHEYQAKRILSRYGINIPKGGIAYTPNEAKRVAFRSSLRGPVDAQGADSVRCPKQRLFSGKKGRKPRRRPVG